MSRLTLILVLHDGPMVLADVLIERNLISRTHLY